jgi:hypothetical protein
MQGVLDYKHRNLTADNIDVELTAIAQSLDGSPVYLDISYNRLNTQALRKVVSFMEKHTQVVACVGYNHFQFPTFYNTLADMMHTEWVETQRIHMGTTEYDRKLDRMAAINMETAGNLSKLAGDVASLLQSSKELGKTATVALHTNAWASNQREAFELVITSTLQEHLISQGYILIDVFPSKHCKLPFHITARGEKVDASQWDGVLMMEKGGKGYTFLVEAKKTKNSKDMMTMPDRMARAESFITVCGSMMTDANIPRAKQNLCYIWNTFKENELRGVLGADALPEDALEMAKEHGIIRIQKNLLGWSVDDDQNQID